MKVVVSRMGWVVALMFVATSIANGQEGTQSGQAGTQADGQQATESDQAGTQATDQQATETGQAYPQAAAPGQATIQQQDPLFDTQPGALEEQDALDTQSTQFDQGRGLDQPDQLGQPGLQQQQRMRQPAQPGLAGEGQPGVLGVMISESAGPGVTIREVVSGTAAAEAGLVPGDVILEINGQGVQSPPQVTQMIRSIPAGQVATITVWRDGQEQQIPATLQAAQQRYQANYRSGGPMGGDQSARIARLESQLASVIQELRQLRQDVMQLRAGGQPGGATGFETQRQPEATQPGFDQFDPTRSGLEEPGTTQPELEEPATQPGLEEPAQPETTVEPALPF